MQNPPGTPGQNATRKKWLSVICSHCESQSVYAYRDGDQVVIRCEACQTRVFAYFTDELRQRSGETPPEDGDPFFKRRVERELLSQCPPITVTLYRFIKEYMRQNTYAPTHREMAEEVGFSSVGAMRPHLDRLEDIGLIERDYATSRAIRLMCTG